VNQSDRQLLENELLQWSEAIQSRPHDPRPFVRRGMVNFKLARINDSIQDFDRAEAIAPSITPYLWQRGLSYYYADRFAEGARQFETDLAVNSHDVEETVWRYLCIARSAGVDIAKASLLAVKNDPRAVMRQVYELYAGERTPDDVLSTGQAEGQSGNFYAHLYVGLYYEAANALDLACAYIITAANTYPVKDDYMWNLALVHQQLRGWG
jgi:tetratricopeptide (TPR) repeat protein